MVKMTSNTMLSITAPSYCPPSGYQLSTLSRPSVTKSTDVLIQVHAASVNPVDLKLASGMLKQVVKDEFPYKVGYDCAGVVTEVGQGVSRIHVGDEVYARLPEVSRGSWSEFAKCEERYVALKPKKLSFAESASLPLAAMTAMQALQKYKGSLAGKTVFIPAGLGGTGSYACQLAKNVFHAGKVITSVSTAKVDLVPKILGTGIVDQIIDYTKNQPNDVIPRGSVDFIFDNTGQAMEYLSLMVPSTSLIISTCTQPSGTQLQNSSLLQREDNPQLSWVAHIILNTMDAVRKARAWRWGVEYSYFTLHSNAEDLETLGKYVDEGKLVPIIGLKVDMKDVEKVREACMPTYNGKGSLGKTVIEVIKS